MKLKLLWVGKTQEEWVKSGIAEYAGRVRRYLPLEIGEAKEEKGPGALDREGERLEKLLPPNAKLVLLDVAGREMSSEELAAFIGRCRDDGVKELAFVIGGAYGLPERLSSRGMRVSLSRMTFTHQMARVILLEQVYRALTILGGEPYHH